MLITIKDETFAGDIIHQIDLEFKTEEVTVKDIITARVTQEVEKYNTKATLVFNGLVTPVDTEKVLNGYKLKSKTFIDAEQQVYIALNAFQQNGYFVIIDNTQAEGLDEVVRLQHNTQISFIKLTPLVGG